MLFQPVRFAGLRVPGLSALAQVLPRRIQQIPGIAHGGIGWQGIIPSRAAKMGSIAVDKGIAKLGSPSEFYKQLDPEKIAEHILVTAREDIRALVERILGPRAPAAVARPAAAVARARARTGPGRAAGDRARDDRRHRRQHRAPDGHQADGDPADRGAAGARQPHLPRGRAQGAALHHQLRLLLRRRARLPDGLHQRGLPLLVGAADRRRGDRLRHQLGRAVDDLRAGRGAQDRPAEDPRPVPAPPARGRGRLRRDHRRRHRHALEHGRRAAQRAAVRSHAVDDRGPAAPGGRSQPREGAPGGPGRDRARVSTTRSANRSPPRRSSTR